MGKFDRTGKLECKCYGCAKISMRAYNYTLRKWVRAFKCSCGSTSFRWSNFGLIN